MRIFEILTEINDVNRVWAALKGLPVERITEQYQKLSKTLDLLEAQRSPARTQAFMPEIEAGIEFLEQIADSIFADESDPDVERIRTEARKAAGTLRTRIRKLR